jgi:site-specific DNA-methyltransferase (adenine-specific)
MSEKLGEFELNKVYCMDCLEGLKKIPDNSINLIITDPPYSINYYSNFGSKEYQKRIQTAESWDNNFNFKLYFNELFRVLKEDSYMIVFGCEENILLMKELGCFQVLIWDKNHCGMGDLSDFGIGYEFMFYFKKGNPHLRGKRINGVITCKHIGFFDKTIHPTQKPDKLFRFLIEKLSDNGNIVLDAFVGSGGSMLASKQLNRKFIGFEINPSYVEIVNKRLSQKNLIWEGILTF